MRGLRIGVVAVLSLAAGDAAAEVYEVGPGRALAAIGDVPWESLGPGDEVRIHWRQEPYREKWVIAVHGTEAEPIVVRGIAGPNGERPVIDGRDATTRGALNYWSETRGVIKIGGANQPNSSYGSYIVIEGLDIRSGRAPYSFTGRNGLTSYDKNASSIFLEHAEHVVIRDCVLRDSGNGLFAASGSVDVLVEGCHIVDNGVEGSIYEHNNYTEADGIVFQFNRFGPLRAGCPGNNLKDRSAGTVIRYNWIEGGNRQLDLVDSDTFTQGDAYVYGNVLVEPDGAGNSQIVHFGGDSGDEGAYRQGTLYFFHNTVVSTRTGNTTLLRLSSAAQHADVRNNVLYASAGGDRLAIVDELGDVDLSGNWLRPGWVDAHGGAAGTITEVGAQVSGDLPGFVTDTDFHLLADSPCRDRAGPLAAGLPAEYAVVAEFGNLPTGSARAVDGPADIGAFEFAEVLPGAPDAGTGSGSHVDGGAGVEEPEDVGCGCRGGASTGWPSLLLLALAALMAVRPRSRRRSPR